MISACRRSLLTVLPAVALGCGALEPTREDARPDAEDREDIVLYRSYAEEEPNTDPMFGPTSTVLVTKYAVLRLFESGQAYVGSNPDAIDTVTCEAPRRDASGRDECVAYAIEGDAIQLGDDRFSFRMDGTSVTIGDTTWQRLPKNPPLRGSLALASWFGQRPQSPNPTLLRAQLELLPDGTFVATRQRHSYQILAPAYWSGCRDDCRIEGTFAVGEHSITLQVAGTQAKHFFLRVGDGEVQIGRQVFRTS
jgi:hypothetical protein